MRRKLSLEEYKKEEKIFFEKYGEYYKKLCTINRAENELIDANSLTNEQEAEFETQREALKEEYKGYTDHYHTDFYTTMDLSNIDNFIDPKENNNKLFRKDLRKYLGKHVKTDWGTTHGICQGIAVTLDDFYWIIKTDTGTEWFSAVGKISFYTKQDRINDRGWCIVTNNKEYL